MFHAADYKHVHLLIYTLGIKNTTPARRKNGARVAQKGKGVSPRVPVLFLNLHRGFLFF